MARVSLPTYVSTLGEQFGIGGVGWADRMFRNTGYGVTPGHGGLPGIVPVNAVQSNGAAISTGGMWLSELADSFWVSGAVTFGISTYSYSSATALFNTIWISGYTGMISSIERVPNTANMFYIRSYHPTGGESGATFILTTGSSGSGTSLSYHCPNMSINAWNNSNSNYVWKLGATTDRSLTATDAYNGWLVQNGTTTSAGAVSGTTRYVTVYVRNRNA